MSVADEARADPGGHVRLLIADVDGTLVTPDKRLTAAAADAVKRLGKAGIGFTLISSRPPRGMGPLAQTLGVSLPFAAFNGGSLVAPDLSLIEAHRLSPEAARQALTLLDERGVEAWVFAAGDWRLRSPDGPRVDGEIRAIGFGPTVTAGFEDVMDRIDKIVGVSDDHALLARVEAEATALIGRGAAILRSQPYYLDITHPEANKGAAVRALCGRIGVPPDRTAVIGDMFNDVAMFEVAGFAVAMGQAPDEVKRHADLVTAPNTEEGFAAAADRLILAQADGKGS